MSNVPVSLSLDQTALAEAFAAQILRELDDTRRDDLVKQAIAYIIKPEKDSYNRPRNSVMEQAFYGAVMDLTRKLAAEVVEADPRFSDAVRAQIQLAMDEVIAGSGSLRDKIVAALVEAVYP